MVDASDGNIQLHGIGTVGYQEIGKCLALFNNETLLFSKIYSFK